MKLFTLILFLAPFLLGCNGDVSSLINSSRFESMLKHRNDQGCSNGFYTHNAFITAGKNWCCSCHNKYICQQLGKICVNSITMIHKSKLWSWLWSFNWQVSNYNYDQVGKAIGVNLLNNPDLVATNPIISFKTAI